MPRKSNKDPFLGSLISDYTKNLQGGDVSDIITFAESVWGLNTKLLPAQRVILKVFYGLELDDQDEYVPVKDMLNVKTLHVFTEKDFMKYLIDEGRVNQREYVPGTPFSEMVLCAGRRGSKSTISSVIANYEIYKLVKRGNPQDYYGFPDGQPICVKSVATSDNQAEELFDMIRAKGLGCKYINDRIINFTQTNFSIQTDRDVELYGNGIKATVSLKCGGSYSNSLRGGNSPLVIFDEAAFFIENGGRFSGTEVYKALTPSVADFVKRENKGKPDAVGDGKILTLSSPYGKSGMFWDLYNRSFDENDTMIMFKLYSSLLNPSIDPNLLSRMYKRDKVSFMCEFGGEFSDSITNWITEVDKVKSYINTDVKANPLKGKTGISYYMGIDIGLKNDGTAIVIVHKEDENIILDWADVYFSGSSDVWEYKDKSIYKNCKEFSGYEIIPILSIAEKIKELSKWFPIKMGNFDQEQGFSLMEILRTHSLNQFVMDHASQGKNTEMYQAIKSLLMEGMIKLFDHPVLIPELLSLEEEKKGNHIRVAAPERMGFHDDISCAFVRAVYQCYKDTFNGPIQYKSLSFAKGGRVNDVNSPFSDLGSYRAFRNKKVAQHGAYSKRNYKNIKTRTNNTYGLASKAVKLLQKNN